jgi:hypothetical protein
VGWIADVMTRMRETGVTEFEAMPDAENRWVEDIAESVGPTLFHTVDSWYMNSNLPGKPRVFTAYFNGMHTYAEICEDVAANDYKGFEMRSKKLAEAPA